MTSLFLLAVLGTEPGSKINFARDIRPILSNKCFECHGPDANRRKADLRLDVEEAYDPDRGAGPLVVAGKPDESEIWRRISTKDTDLQMPPRKFGKQLTEPEKSLIRQWIEQGSKWGRHWAFVPPERPEVPAVQIKEWVRNPIDAFVLKRLEDENLKPAPVADRAKLLRRLSLDLIGLPPTLGELEAFIKDQSPTAEAKAIGRLLESPHYGERWARMWLDAARYADSDGFEKDKSRQVWMYRDWVVNAFNRNLPYDQFIIQQLAGDLLPNAGQDERVATGFLRNSMINEEGGIDPEQFRMEAMFDRMDALGKGVLGLTIQCAQCHSHKFDPMSHSEYYRMFAYFNNCHEANIAVYTPAEIKERERIFAEIKKIESTLKSSDPKWRDKMSAWEGEAKNKLTSWQIVRPAVDDISTGGQRYLPQPDGSFLALGYAPTKHRVMMTIKVENPRITAFQLELLTDPNLPLGGPGRSIKGTGALTEFEVEAAPADQPDKKTRVKIKTASADFNPLEKPLESIFDDKSNKKRITGPIGFAIDGKDETAWCTDAGPGRSNVPRKAVFLPEKPIEHKAGTVLTFYLKQNHGGWNSDDNQNCNLGRFRLSITSENEPTLDPLPSEIRAIISSSTAKRTPIQENKVFSYWRTIQKDWAKENEQIEQLWRQHPAGTSQLVLAERTTQRPTFVLDRGDFLKHQEKVDPGTPGFLHDGQAVGDRLAFARWVVDRKSPTTARAFVNRIWQAYFGRGLVATPEDLGSQSEPPTHPQLLDWLAVEFMESGWDIRHLHRLIVASNTYRQSSKASQELEERDPENRLLARGPRFRVEGETVRDIALATSGLLNPRLGGRSVFPPAPAFLFQPPASYGPKIWPEDKGPERYRRALYTFRYRSVPMPMLQTFDAPNGDSACVCRPRSNTPLQALTSLNEPLFMECYRALGMRMLSEGGASIQDQIGYGFRLCTARDPSEKEREFLLGLFNQQQERFSQPNAKPWQLAANDPSKPPTLPKGKTPADAAAATALARVLLNLDETITKE